ncbi:YnfC family lipoprotein [Providencia rustigianii]|uniref:YnfC family lipoprotein n=9 Tax=Providencia rustigianii TaxID=158850 RepID=D1P562_9GAMM|nr:YnfC family lipoprotein [Providencia rustigianii]EFB71423.1 hypothetical protein PROVRUST_07367 [Providencia rustigianii DSM 4541]SUC27334.1 lipoprotein [Providencia rustigianii]
MKIEILPVVAYTVAILIPFKATAMSEQKYNPVVFNMAQMYDFNPVKGNVKEVKSTIYNEDNSINYISNLKIGRDGCIDEFSLSQVKDEYINSIHNELFVKRVKDKLIGEDINGPVEMEIGKDCLVLSKKDSNGKLLYEYNDDGFIKGSMIKSPNIKLNEYHYDKDNRLYAITYYSENKVFSETVVEYDKDPAKPYDVLLEVKVMNQSALIADTKCEYDKRGVSYKCNFVLTLTPNGKTIKLNKRSTTEVIFY